MHYFQPVQCRRLYISCECTFSYAFNSLTFVKKFFFPQKFLYEKMFVSLSVEYRRLCLRVGFILRKNFSLVFVKRQTIKGYNKAHSQLKCALRHYTDEKQCISRTTFFRKFFISISFCETLDYCHINNINIYHIIKYNIIQTFSY